jgi:hypothetical protein
VRCRRWTSGLTFGEAVRNTCGDASTSVQMFEPVPVMSAGHVSASGGNAWRPPVYTIRSQLPGEYCINSLYLHGPTAGQVFVPRPCEDFAGHKYFMIQVLPGLSSFRITGYYSNGHPDLDLPCVTMGTFDGINRPGYADCVGTTLSGIPANQRWEFVGLAP